MPVRQTSIETTALSITLLAVATIVYYEAGAECGFPRSPPEVEKGEPPLSPTDEMIQQAEKVMQDLTEGVECSPGSAPDGNTTEGTLQSVREHLGLDESPGVPHVRHPEEYDRTRGRARRQGIRSPAAGCWILL